MYMNFLQDATFDVISFKHTMVRYVSINIKEKFI